MWIDGIQEEWEYCYDFKSLVKVFLDDSMDKCRFSSATAQDNRNEIHVGTFWNGLFGFLHLATVTRGFCQLNNHFDKSVFLSATYT